MDTKTRDAFENIEFYKFYPAQSPGIPDISAVKASLFCFMLHIMK